MPGTGARTGGAGAYVWGVMTTTASGIAAARKHRVSGRRAASTARSVQRGATLLEDKLRIPRTGLAVLRRDRVTELIDAAATRRVALIVGPAGAGKTVAAAMWARSEAGGRRTAWLTLDPADREPGQFWHYVMAALARAGAITAPAPGAVPVGAIPPGNFPAGTIPPGSSPAGTIPPGAAEAKVRRDAGATETGLADPAVADPTVADAAVAEAAVAEAVVAEAERTMAATVVAAGDGPSDIAQRVSAIAGTAADPVVLVLDDLHVLAGSKALAGLDDLIRHAPPGLRILLVGRHAAGLPLARLRVAGELAGISAADLACTDEETSAYLSMLNAPFSMAEYAGVLRRTEGWMAGLRLAVLGAGTSEADGQIMLADYIEDEVLGRPGSQTRAFLLRTSLTEELPADLARELTGNPSAERVLEQLSRDNGLVQAISPEAGLFRYHPMLREVLAAALRRELPEELPGLQRRVARWHADQGEVLPAVQAAAAIGDWDFVAEVLRDAGPVVMLSAEGPQLEQVLSGFPPDRLGTDVGLAVAMAASRLWQGDADGALPHLESAQNGLQGLADADEKTTALWLAALRTLYQAGIDDADPGWLDQMWSLGSGAHDDSGGVPGHRALGMLWLAIGFAALRDLDGQQARSALLHAGSQLSAGGVHFLRERARSWESVACALYGDLAAATRLYASVIDGPHGRDSELAPVLALAAALVSLARDEPAAAGAQLDEADLAAGPPRPAGEPSIAVLSGIQRARLAITDGNFAGARGLVRWLTDAAAGLAGSSGQGVGQAIAVLDAEISLAAGERERARATLAGLTGTPAAAARSAAPTICRARFLIAAEDDKAALSLMKPLLADPVGTCSIADRIGALLTAAVAHRRLGQATDAVELLEEALALAEPDDASGAFVAAGPAVRSALTVLISPASRCAAFAGRILDRFDGRTTHRAAPMSSTALTESELAVLRFLPSHMTNQEIAESLFLSINTIKTHLSSVYRKLGVVNRRQAIAQGRRLELLLRRLARHADGSVRPCCRAEPSLRSGCYRRLRPLPTTGLLAPVRLAAGWRCPWRPCEAGKPARRGRRHRTAATRRRG